MAKINKKRTVDNWKKKKWYKITADDVFNNKEIGKTVALDSKNLVGRNIQKPLDKITNNIRDSANIITFKINKITAGNAETQLIEYNTKGGNLSRLTRRGKSKIDNVIYVTTKDGKKLKLKVFFISGKKFTTQTRKEARNMLKEFFEKEVSEITLKETWNNIIYKKLSDKLKKILSKLGYVNKALVVRAKLI
jgi:small subunit ribosomal protein S3Ae